MMTSTPTSRPLTHKLGVAFAALLVGFSLVALGSVAPAMAASEHEAAAGDTEGAHAAAGAHGVRHGDPTAHFNWTDFGYGDKDAAGGTLEKGEETMTPPFVLMLVNFGLLLILLGWKAMPPIRRATRQRSEKIADALEEAARLRSDAKAKLDEYSDRIKDAEREVDELIKGIRADAESEKNRIIAAAEAQAAALKRDAETRIAAEIARARTTLEREVVAAAIAAAETVLRDKATAADQTRLVDGFLADVKSATSTSARPEKQ